MGVELHKISFATMDRMQLMFEHIEQDVWPEETIPIREPESKVYITDIQKANSNEEEWFKNEFLNIFKDYFVYFFSYYDEKDYRKHLYAIYANRCYKNHKRVTIPFVTFNKWLNEYVLNRIYMDNGGTIISTFKDMNTGRQLLKFTYLELKAVETQVNRERSLEEQKELIDKIYDCFEYRRKTENVLNRIIMNNLEISSMELIVNEFYIKHEPDQTQVLLDNQIINFTYDEELKQYVKEQIEKEISGENKKDTALDPIKMYTQEEIKFAFAEMEDFNKYLLKENPSSVESEAREFAKMSWKIRQHFLSKGKDYEPYIIRWDDNEIYINCYKEFNLKYKDETFYRAETMEEIYNLDVLLYEIEKERTKYLEDRQIADEKAKKHFFQFLSSENRERFDSENYVLLESAQNYYVLHKLKTYNNILMISKDKREKKTLCICPENLQISEFDVFTTIAMMLQSGQEETLLNIGNEYPFLEKDEDIFQQIFIKENIA